MSFFRFKKFTIEQDGVAMKVGTDGVLLGAWCGVEGASRALDIGTGTGMIAIMLAQRGEDAGLEVDAVEIDRASSEQAAGNVAACPWSDRLNVLNKSVQEYADEYGAEKKYDLIVSNPPYFTDSLLPPDKSRTAARHTTELGFEDLLRSVAGLLSRAGRFAVVLPYEHGSGFAALAGRYGLGLVRRTDVITKPGAHPKRVLMEFGNGFAGAADRGTITIEGDGPHGFSLEYISLTRDFYLKF